MPRVELISQAMEGQECTPLTNTKTANRARAPSFALFHRRRAVPSIDLVFPYLEDPSGRESIRWLGLPACFDGFPDRIRQPELNGPLRFLWTFLVSELEYHSGIWSVRERRAPCEYLCNPETHL